MKDDGERRKKKVRRLRGYLTLMTRFAVDEVNLTILSSGREMGT